MLTKRLLLILLAVLLTGSLLARQDAPAALFQQANRLYQAEKYEQALELYKKVLSLDPYDADTYYDMGLAYYKKGEIDKAKKYLRETLNIDKKHLKAKTLLEILEKK